MDEKPTRDLVLAETKRAMEAAFTPERAAVLLREIEIGWPAIQFPRVVLRRDPAHRTVYISSFEMHFTYEGVLEGVPSHEPMIAAARRAFGGTPTYLIQPPLRLLKRDPEPDIWILPTWRCAALLRSFEPIDPASDYSKLAVSWFRNDDEPLIPANVIAEIEWEKYAEDSEY